DSDENSQDSNTSDLNMTTIPELADAIDGYLDNTRINSSVLVNQIKRATRQIRRKYTNLQTDQINEQRVRYNVEAERDNALNDLNMMITVYNNEVKE
ncbi:4919_t:CDS:1, partial [Diversispora eburnea]